MQGQRSGCKRPDLNKKFEQFGELIRLVQTGIDLVVCEVTVRRSKSDWNFPGCLKEIEGSKRRIEWFSFASHVHLFWFSEHSSS